MNLRLTSETKDFSRRRRACSIFFSQQVRTHKSIRLSENIFLWHDQKTVVSNCQRSSTCFSIFSLRNDLILNKMEDFSRFLIFEFEISNADPDSRSDALAHTVQKELPFSRTPNTHENPFQRENIERESPFHRQAIDTVSYPRRLRHRYSMSAKKWGL